MNKIEAYAKGAKESWGETPEYKEYEEKSRNRTPAEQKDAAGGDFTQNIDSAGGAGTAAFTNEAIQVYCGK